jgi:RNA polymerase sigma-70 factor (ECF subfamily)
MADEPRTESADSLDDTELLRRIAEGDQDRYADLIQRYQGHVGRIVSRRVPSDRVEEIVHEVFVRAYFGLALFSHAVPIDRWLAGIAVRACYDFWRTRTREELPVGMLTHDQQQWIARTVAAQSDDTFRDQARKREAAEVLAWALGHLSPENRAVLTLIHLEGHSVREASQLLGWTMVTVKVRAYRARQALRKILESSSMRQP